MIKLYLYSKIACTKFWFSNLTRFTTVLILTSVLIGGLMGCGNKTSKPEETEHVQSSSVSKMEIKYAKGFNITYHDHYKIVSMRNSFDTSAVATQYILLDRGYTVPEVYKNEVIIEIPIRSMVAMSSMHIGLLEFLESESILTGLSDLQYVYSPKVIEMIDAQKVSEVGNDQAINQEKLISLNPDLVMASGSPASKIEKYHTLKMAHIPVIVNSEWVETTPLARAEWVKLMAALLDKEALVNEKFEKLEQEYHQLIHLTKDLKDKPTIIPGQNNKDVWFIPGGDSYMAQYFKDAGGTYLWATEKKTGSIAMNFEAVYPIALTADFWLNVGYLNTDTKATIFSQDARYVDFKSLKSGNMYNYTNRTNSRGANDYFESANVQPQIVLSDLIKILHPQILPNHQLVYYKKLD